PELRRSSIQTLKLRCEAATYSSGRKVDVGVVRDGMDNQIVRLGASNEPARNVLMRLIASRAWADSNIVSPILRVSWSLLYGPDVNMYVLNIHVVTAKLETPTGHVI